MSGIGLKRRAALTARCLAQAGAWLAVNALLAFGLLFVLFALFANGSAVTFFAEAGNLAQHFAAATAEARMHFLLWVKGLAGVLFAAVCAGRLPFLASQFGRLRRGAGAPCPYREGVWCDGR